MLSVRARIPIAVGSLVRCLSEPKVGIKRIDLSPDSNFPS